MRFQNWCLENASSLNLEITKLRWVKDFFTDYFDFQVKLNIDGKILEGYGLDRNQDNALTKAIVEAIERNVVKNEILTSNGIAAHVDLAKAKENARNELIERDLFLSHFYSSTPFTKLTNEEFQIPSKIQNYIKEYGDQIALFKSKKSNHGTTYITVISNLQEWGGIVSIQLSKNNDYFDILKCVINASRTYRFERTTDNFKKQINIDVFKNLKYPSFDDHQSLALDPSYFNKINFLFLGHTNNDSIIHYENEDFTFQELDLPKSLIGCPLHIIKCDNVKTIPLCAGFISEEDFLVRSKKLFIETERYKFNPLPHPLS